MQISNQVNVVGMCLVEVKGQIKENGSGLKDAARQLNEATSLLEELIDGRH